MEKERIANIPVPHTAKRLDVRFGGKSKKSKDIKTSDKGCRFESTTPNRATLIIATPCSKEPYTLDDFPEDAEDLPGHFEENVIYPEPEPVEEPKEDDEAKAPEKEEEDANPNEGEGAAAADEEDAPNDENQPSDQEEEKDENQKPESQPLDKISE